MTASQLGSLLNEQPGRATFAPFADGAMPWLDAARAEPQAFALDQPRAAQSPKALFFPAAESVGRYGPAAEAASATCQEQIVVLGIRACELRALRYLDQIFLEGDFEDAAYRRRREATLLVSCDCADCTDSCACTLMGGRPYPTEGFDVNLTLLNDGFLAEPATPKGQEWLAALGPCDPAEAAAEDLARRDTLREEMTARVREQNAGFGFSASDTEQPRLPDDADDAWRQFSADCVECGACTHVCPTCHCFYLYDQVLGPEAFERLRTWDSCLLSSYHRMAGGPNMKLSPRPRLASRLANRVLHKFAYSPQQYGRLGCVGCGRCIDACAGAIDIREVVKELGE
jgi:hypothetical protein